MFLSRRGFLSVPVLAALSRVALGRSKRLWPPGGGRLVFKRSGSGRRISNAAKAHNANRLYRTRAVAASDVPHPGDRSTVVWLLISDKLFARLFVKGNLIADLRTDL